MTVLYYGLTFVAGLMCGGLGALAFFFISILMQEAQDYGS